MIQQVLPDTSWQVFLEQDGTPSFYHSQAWLDLITKLYGYSVMLLTTSNQAGQITGFLPLCSMHSPLTGRRLVSLPFSDSSPIVATDDASANDLIDQAIGLAQGQKVRYLELRPGINEVAAKRPELVKGDLYV